MSTNPHPNISKAEFAMRLPGSHCWCINFELIAPFRIDQMEFAQKLVASYSFQVCAVCDCIKLCRGQCDPSVPSLV